ncbi:hypothetical protein [Helicobacter sp. 11S02596-1]|uniref:hypothetical protein n=1 Tax=Helicobacter sp. 11S02596-1 TaxID=1476194 RepID=UPI000BA70243|nr:hypothetical protein [Helicobacter sp. 11S02596-1]PAF41126.1 hypothetical protein BJI48_09030 [Helicobacter sp. 11S02596-1]
MKIYKLPQEKRNEVTGELKTITSTPDFIYVRSEEDLPAPFVASELPESYIKEQLDSQKAKRINDMNQICDKALEKLRSNTLGTPHLYNMTKEDQINLLGLMIAGVDSFFRCAEITLGVDGREEIGAMQNIPHNKEQLKTLYEDALKFKSATLFKCGQKKELIANAKDILEVLSVRWEDKKEENTPNHSEENTQIPPPATNEQTNQTAKTTPPEVEK